MLRSYTSRDMGRECMTKLLMMYSKKHRTTNMLPGVLRRVQPFVHKSSNLTKMPRNVEIKARVSDLESLKKTTRALANDEGTIIVQEDTFFNAPNGRLKLREIKTVLDRAMGVKGVVCKTRLLIMVGQTRVHLDEVKGLGQFMELEVVLRDDQTTEDGQKIAEELMEKFGISKDNLLTGAYMDMLLKDN
ncbi:uncharacterized protein LOC101845581 [Aplysia californica]|uniref:Uncharacterized protein LOC101845581 n=1 Tax=Aplysia californica TaxID=6500 RepID=A0ABM0K708_APLCA|nr:uncharacterized protein LOC101845581 [Aplysia californica]